MEPLWGKSIRYKVHSYELVNPTFRISLLRRRGGGNFSKSKRLVRKTWEHRNGYFSGFKFFALYSFPPIQYISLTRAFVIRMTLFICLSSFGIYFFIILIPAYVYLNMYIQHVYCVSKHVYVRGPLRECLWARRLRRTLLLHTTCAYSWCTWRAICVAAFNKNKKLPYMSQILETQELFPRTYFTH